MRAPMIAVGAGMAALLALRRARNWGALPFEMALPVPGDELVPEPASRTTMGVHIDAPPGEVWRWLVQIGQDRGGMYSYERLENLFGLHVDNADMVHERWQRLAVGDRIVLVPKGWGPLPDGYALTVARIEYRRLLVLRQAPPEHPWNAVWTFMIEPVDATCCRLVSRSRAQSPESAALRLATAAMAPITTIMTRRMLLGIKQRAEAAVWPSTVVPRPVETVETVLGGVS
jgi:hypothetical protein